MVVAGEQEIDREREDRGEQHPCGGVNHRRGHERGGFETLAVHGARKRHHAESGHEQHCDLAEGVEAAEVNEDHVDDVRPLAVGHRSLKHLSRDRGLVDVGSRLRGGEGEHEHRHPNGSGDDGVVAQAIDWCVASGAHVVSLSLGGAPGILPFSFGGGDRSSGDAANDAIDEGVYVVAAAGNDGGENDDGDVAHPASEASVIAVGGVTLQGTHWSGSSEGDNNGRILPLPVLLPRNDPDRKPEVVAPAEAVPVLLNDGSWGLADGTSAATVYVTGAIALLLESKPELIPGENAGNAENVETVKQWLMDSVTPQEGQAGHDDQYGYGLLNIRALLDASQG
ncbi:MAG: hypothetical protein EBY49_07285 [Actinobacteria bacterium]|nr:hypothetical protein [Actinomycetota bacterium]